MSTISAHLLVVDDEPMLRDMISDALRFAGYEVSVAADGVEAIRTVRADQPDLVVLDVNMPGDDGFVVARQIRSLRPDLAVLFLTARDDTDDLRAGFEAGGDDYLTKPFRLEELQLRVDAILRRTVGLRLRSNLLRCGDLELDDDRHVVQRGGEQISLTPTEYRLLHHLLHNVGSVVTRERLLEAVWGYGYGDSVLETSISQLRKKIDASEPKLLHTIRGFGYSLRTPPE